MRDGDEGEDVLAAHTFNIQTMPRSCSVLFYSPFFSLSRQTKKQGKKENTPGNPFVCGLWPLLLLVSMWCAVVEYTRLEGRQAANRLVRTPVLPPLPNCQSRLAQSRRGGRRRGKTTTNRDNIHIPVIL